MSKVPFIKMNTTKLEALLDLLLFYACIQCHYLFDILLHIFKCQCFSTGIQETCVKGECTYYTVSNAGLKIITLNCVKTTISY